MKKKYVLVVDIGSSKIRAILASRGLNNTFNIKSERQEDYDGFFEGKFINEERLPIVLKRILDDEIISNVEKVYISVPAEFSSVRTTEASTHFGIRKKIKKSDVDSLLYMASEKAKNGNVEVVSVSPINYVIDDGRIVSEPVGESAISLTGNLSIVYADNYYISLFNNILSAFDFTSVEYLSDPLSQCLFVIPKDKREDLAVLVDVGDLTTSIAFAKGNGLIGLTSFSRGGAFLTNDLSEALEISLAEADRIKRQIVLSLKGNQGDYYELGSDNGKTVKISLNSANEVVAYRIEEISQVISKCVQMWGKDIYYIPIFLTGGGIAKIKGGRDYLAKCLGKNITYGVPPLPLYDKPELSSTYSLVNEALKSENA